MNKKQDVVLCDVSDYKYVKTETCAHTSKEICPNSHNDMVAWNYR